MCPHPQSGTPQVHTNLAAQDDSNGPKEAFPWEGGAFDAHCHPTDTMPSIKNISGMRAQTFTLMSTRFEDQDLVDSVAKELGILNRGALDPANRTDGRVVPAFGWHPWFSYLLYDDSLPAKDATYDSSSADREAQKSRHYNIVLAPPPCPEFVNALPDPQPLSDFVQATRSRLEAHPLGLVGEVGLDRVFRLPNAWTQDEHSARDEGLTPGGREGRLLSPYRVRMAHQRNVLRAQLRLAGEMGRPASVHGVQAPGLLFDLMHSLWKGHEREVVSRRAQKRVAPGAEDFSDSSEDEDGVKPLFKPKPFPPRVCLHSFSGPVQVMEQYLGRTVPVRFFFSFSTVVNLSTPWGEGRFLEAVRTCPDDLILVESDLHYAGEDMDVALEQMYRRICDIKGWSLEEGVAKIRRNYEEFLFG